MTKDNASTVCQKCRHEFIPGRGPCKCGRCVLPKREPPRDAADPFAGCVRDVGEIEGADEPPLTSAELESIAEGRPIRTPPPGAECDPLLNVDINACDVTVGEGSVTVQYPPGTFDALAKMLEPDEPAVFDEAEIPQQNLLRGPDERRTAEMMGEMERLLAERAEQYKDDPYGVPGLIIIDDPGYEPDAPKPTPLDIAMGERMRAKYGPTGDTGRLRDSIPARRPCGTPRHPVGRPPVITPLVDRVAYWVGTQIYRVCRTIEIIMRRIRRWRRRK